MSVFDQWFDESDFSASGDDDELVSMTPGEFKYALHEAFSAGIDAGRNS